MQLLTSSNPLLSELKLTRTPRSLQSRTALCRLAALPVPSWLEHPHLIRDLVRGGQETLSKAGGAVSQLPGWDEERALQAAPSGIHPSLGPHLDCALLTWPCTLIPAHRQEPSAPRGQQGREL